MNLKDVQNVSLDILDNFHSFCTSNNIKYSLAYGTLLGAIRHQGFIPWDDDVDVVMLREDFDRFCELYPDSKDYKLFSYKRKNMYAACARLCETNKTLVITGYPLFTEDVGVWIDIFPIDIVEDCQSSFSKAVDLIIKADYDTKMKRFSLLPLRFQTKSIKNILCYLKRKLFLYHSIDYYINRHLSLISTVSSNNGKLACQLSCPDSKVKECVPISVFENYIKVNFEGHQFYAVSNYDLWLTTLYEDYMKLPPLDERQRGHTYHDYYWK